MFFSLEILKNVSTPGLILDSLSKIWPASTNTLVEKTSALFAMVDVGGTKFLAELVKCFAHHAPMRDNL